MTKSLESDTAPRVTHKPRVVELRFMHPDSGKYTVKYLDVYMDEDRKRLVNTIVWARENKVELRILPA